MELKRPARRNRLRSGYTTGACAAAAAKAATQILFASKARKPGHTNVEIPFPDGSRVKFKIHCSELITHDSELVGRASVIKDAGDDPDVTNGAEIIAEARKVESKKSELIIKGGKGVGVVTKPGLAVPVGEAAINPIPRQMITEAALEGVQEFKDSGVQGIEITISVTDGERLAKKTLNHRLGIVGGISILGTTGIVRPVSAEAWTATITASLDVAKAMGRREIVLSAGRASEKAHIAKFRLPDESYVMMGDYLEFSLLEAKKHGFKKIHLSAQWAKMLKIAMATPQTHVRHGAIDLGKAVDFLRGLGIGEWKSGQEFNTAREIFDYIDSAIRNPQSALFKVCLTARKYAEGIAGIPVVSHLVSYEGEIIADSE